MSIGPCPVQCPWRLTHAWLDMDNAVRHYEDVTMGPLPCSPRYQQGVRNMVDRAYDNLDVVLSDFQAMGLYLSGPAIGRRTA